MPRITHIENITLPDGDKGKVTFYENGTVKIFWNIFPKNVYGTLYSYTGSLLEIKVSFVKRPQNVVVLETFIKSHYDQVRGMRQNIKSYSVKIKNKDRCAYRGIATPYNKHEEIKVNLCRHPSKNRSKHGAKTEVNHVYKAGAMSPK